MRHEVDELIEGLRCKTCIWISLAGRKGMAEFRGKKRKLYDQLLARLNRFAIAGFAEFEKQGGLKLEWGEVYRIGHPIDLFRLIGFYDGGKTSFIIIDAFTKRGQKLSAAERQRINEVVRVKRERDWRKKGDPGGTFPRLQG